MHKYGAVKLRILVSRLRDHLIGGWYFPGDEMSGNRLSLLCVTLVHNGIANLTEGNSLTGLLLLMDANDGMIGIVGMIPFAANTVQVLAPMILERFSKRKKLLRTFRFIALTVNALLLSVIPFFPVSGQLRLTMVAVTVGIVNCIHAVLDPGFITWHKQFLPDRVRAHYFSTQSVAVGVTAAAVTLGASRLVDVFKSAGDELTGILIIRGVAFLLVFLDSYLLSRMKEYDYETSGKAVSLKDVFTRPLRSKPYACSVAIAVMWSFVANIPGSFFTVYLLKNVGVSYSFITLTSLLNIPCMIIFTPLWRR